MPASLHFINLAVSSLITSRHNSPSILSSLFSVNTQNYSRNTRKKRTLMEDLKIDNTCRYVRILYLPENWCSGTHLGLQWIFSHWVYQGCQGTMAFAGSEAENFKRCNWVTWKTPKCNVILFKMWCNCGPLVETSGHLGWECAACH